MLRREEQSEGLLIVSRIDFVVQYGFANNPGRLPILGLSRDEVARKYRGFDGDVWGGRDIEIEYDFLPESGLGALNDFERITQILRKDFGENSDLIFIGGLSKPEDLPNDFVFAGYDFGYYIDPYDHFSVIFNEVIYGMYPEMRKFGDLLNENLLFSQAEDGEQLMTIHRFLEEKGCDVEELDIGHAIGIWLYGDEKRTRKGSGLRI